MKNVLVGLSGGVDSAVCVKKLLNDGYSVAGVYLDMKNTDNDKPVEVINTENENDDIKSAFQCAKSYDIKLYKFGCAGLFDTLVKNNFVSEYSKGRTPNPCVVCNRLVKFASLEKCADILGYENIATGHYAGVGFDNDTGRYYVETGLDEKKEQSYMLWNLTQSQLSRIIFPLCNTVKSENFDTAKKDALSAANRKESLDICFIEKNDNYADFIERRIGKFPSGDFISPDGKVCGKHKGIIHYTVGQRKGLGIALGEPVFVKRIDSVENSIYLARSGEEYSDTLKVSGLNFVGLAPTDRFEGELSVKIRYAAKAVLAKVIIDGDVCTVKFPESVRAATPGQSAVFYSGNRIMFGGFIDSFI
ncbi:MAG: tRNA 2-thiouridine(34) synthase MnmA [Clostridia bacterium]|nr:tRNA 2-thiouridine(34) synthase MnmA [Clostridia bacterium]